MTSCREYQELISRMLDDDLSKEERGALAAHVKICPDCAAVYVAFRSLSEHLSEDPEEVPDALHENIMAEVRRDKIRARSKAQRSHRSWHTVLTVAACLVLIIAAGLSLPKLAPRMGSSAPATQAAPAEAEQFSMAEEPMAAPAPLPEEKEGEAFFESGGDAMKNAEAFRDEVAAEQAAEAAVPREPRYDADGALILDAEQSAVLLDCLSGEARTLEQEPDLELHVLLLKDGDPKPLTILFVDEEALYVRLDGDCTCRIDLSRTELLALFGLSDQEVK